MLWIRNLQAPHADRLACSPSALLSRGSVAQDDRAHARFQAASLSVKGVITWHQIPTKNENGEMEIKSWPMILPHDLA